MTPEEDQAMLLQLRFDVLERAEIALINVCAFAPEYCDVLARIDKHKQAIMSEYVELGRISHFEETGDAD